MKRFAYAFLLLALSPAQSSAQLAQGQIIQSFFEGQNYKGAQIYLDMLLQQKTFRNLEEKIRLVLMNSLASAYSRDFAKSYRLLDEAKDLLEWSGFQDTLTYDQGARQRIEQSIEIVFHDIRKLESLKESHQ